MDLKRIATRAAVALVVAGVAIQIAPVPRSNPPVQHDAGAPEPVAAILRSACYDCHSHETVWPWYSRIAPVSWLIAHDVREGRETLNFSRWDRLDGELRARLMRKIWDEVEEGEMPPLLYRLGHAAARLTPEQREALHVWARGEGNIGPAARRLFNAEGRR